LSSYEPASKNILNASPVSPAKKRRLLRRALRVGEIVSIWIYWIWGLLDWGKLIEKKMALRAEDFFAGEAGGREEEFKTVDCN
jgi:hypothetical protein